MVDLEPLRQASARAPCSRSLCLAQTPVLETLLAHRPHDPAGQRQRHRRRRIHARGGLVLALYPRSELAKDAEIPSGPPKTGELSIGHLVENRAEVDALLAQAEEAGATLTGQPHDRPWGIYSGYFRDPDGHLWEIIWHPPSENTAP